MNLIHVLFVTQVTDLFVFLPLFGGPHLRHVILKSFPGEQDASGLVFMDNTLAFVQELARTKPDLETLWLAVEFHDDECEDLSNEDELFREALSKFKSLKNLAFPYGETLHSADLDNPFLLCFPNLSRVSTGDSGYFRESYMGNSGLQAIPVRLGRRDCTAAEFAADVDHFLPPTLRSEWNGIRVAKRGVLYWLLADRLLKFDTDFIVELARLKDLRLDRVDKKMVLNMLHGLHRDLVGMGSVWDEWELRREESKIIAAVQTFVPFLIDRIQSKGLPRQEEIATLLKFLLFRCATRFTDLFEPIAKMAHAHGVRIGELRKGSRKETLLHFLARHKLSGATSASFLIKNREKFHVDVNAVDIHGATALHRSVTDFVPNCIFYLPELLLAANARTDIICNQGKTPLAVASIQYLGLLINARGRFALPEDFEHKWAAGSTSIPLILRLTTCETVDTKTFDWWVHAARADLGLSSNQSARLLIQPLVEFYRRCDAKASAEVPRRGGRSRGRPEEEIAAATRGSWYRHVLPCSGSRLRRLNDVLGFNVLSADIDFWINQ